MIIIIFHCICRVQELANLWIALIKFYASLKLLRSYWWNVNATSFIKKENISRSLKRTRVDKLMTHFPHSASFVASPLTSNRHALEPRKIFYDLCSRQLKRSYNSRTWLVDLSLWIDRTASFVFGLNKHIGVRIERSLSFKNASWCAIHHCV